jgi:ABC-type phosphate transport system substrate-binding protein
MKVRKAIKKGDRVAIDAKGYGTMFGEVKRTDGAIAFVEWEGSGTQTRHDTTKEHIKVIGHVSDDSPSNK